MATANRAHTSRRPNGRAPDFDLQSAIEALPTEYLDCRDMGHSWRRMGAEWDAQARCYDTSQRCTRCKAIRYRTIGKKGAKAGSHYDYRPGYLITGMGQLTESEHDLIRLESVLRALPADVAKAG